MVPRASLLLLLLAVSSAGARDVWVVSYLPEWRLPGADWEHLAAGSSVVLLFSAEPASDGRLLHRDRLPPPAQLAEARQAAARHGAALAVCFGGNGRSEGFAALARDRRAARRFAKGAAMLVANLGLDGVDINWEYPGFRLGRGWLPEADVAAEYEGLAYLLKQLRKALGAQAFLSIAYYPDSRQERLLKQHGCDEHVDLMHAMAYDQPGGHHSSVEFARKVLRYARDAELPSEKVTLGVPFYGRDARSGDWRSWEDLVLEHGSQAPGTDEVGLWTYNGPETLARKVRDADEAGLGGVMVWEAGQDCRTRPVERDARVHVQTCPRRADSLLVALREAVEGLGHGVHRPALGRTAGERGEL